MVPPLHFRRIAAYRPELAVVRPYRLSPGQKVVRRYTGGQAPMSSDASSYCYGRKLLGRVGWEMYLGDDGQGRERWEPITDVRITGDRVLITVTDGTTYATGYADAVRCRRPSPVPDGER